MGYFAGQIEMLSLMALPFLFAVTMPLAAKAYVANHLGDPSPRLTGRLSFDPLKHSEMVGTVVMPIMSVLVGLPFLMGGGKQLDVQPAHFKDGKKGMLKFIIAGPLANLLMAVLCAYLLRLAYIAGVDSSWMLKTLAAGVWLNSIFLIISLIPIPPLDGGLIIAQLLPDDMAHSYMSVAPYGFFIILGIIMFATVIITGPSYMLYSGLLAMAGAG